jgi:tRNA-2-methylthio-N6-dimethylallyladenosine synthase
MPDDVLEAEKTRRILALQDLQRDIQRARHAAAVGRVETVLVDSLSRRRDWEVSGRTAGNSIVNFPGRAEWIGRLIPVRITEGAPNTLRGEALYAD